MKRFVIEYWFRRKFFEKDYDEIIIIAKNEKDALKSLKNIRGRIFSPKILSVTPIESN